MCNASHMFAGKQTEFTCGICKKRFKSAADVAAEDELDLALAKAHKKVHARRIKCAPIFPIPTTYIIPCVLHLHLANVRHLWSDGVAWHIKNEQMAKEVMALLKDKCGVCIKVGAVGASTRAQVKGISLNGRQSSAVLALYPLFLYKVWGVTAEEAADTTNTTGAVVSVRNRLIAARAHLSLWHALTTRMARPDGTRTGPLPASVIEAKATELDEKAKAYRLAFKGAFGNAACRPYTHMSSHLGDKQRAVQSDLMDYSGEAVEHYGKEMKMVVRYKTNRKLGKAATDDRAAEAGYLEQALTVLEVRKQVAAEFPFLVKSSHAKRLQREGSMARPIIVLDDWPEGGGRAPLTEQKYEKGAKAREVLEVKEAASSSSTK